MLLKRKSFVVAVSVGVLLPLASCSKDQPVEEPVAPAPESSEPASPSDVPVDAIYFAFDDYTLNSDAQSKLSSLAEQLKTKGGATVQIEGHCDERGSTEYNFALGKRRAQSAKNYLTQLGIDGGRVATISHGEERPKVDGHDEAAWSQNRRAEFNISGQ